jgi:hypothetical protein
MVWSSKENLWNRDTGNGTLELNFKGEGCTGCSRRECSTNILQEIKNTQNSWHDVKKEDTGDFFPTDSYKTETMPAEGSHFTD